MSDYQVILRRNNYRVVLDEATGKYVSVPLEEILKVEDLNNVDKTITVQDKFVLIFDGTANKWKMRLLTMDDLPVIDGGVY